MIKYILLFVISFILSYLFGNRIIFPELLELHSIWICVICLGFTLCGIFGIISSYEKNKKLWVDLLQV